MEQTFSDRDVRITEARPVTGPILRHAPADQCQSDPNLAVPENYSWIHFRMRLVRVDARERTRSSPDAHGSRCADQHLSARWTLERNDSSGGPSALLRQTIGADSIRVLHRTGHSHAHLAIASRHHPCVCDHPLTVMVVSRPKGVDDDTTHLVGESPGHAGRDVDSYRLRSISVLPVVHVRIPDGAL